MFVLQTREGHAYHVRKATRSLLGSQSTVESAVPASMTPNEKQLRALDELVTERLLSAGGAGMGVRRKLLAGEGVTAAVR